MVLAVVFGPIPTIPVSVASGVVFGGIPGFALAVFGALLGAWISFYIARAVGQTAMGRLFRGHATFCPHCSTRVLFRAVLGARLISLVSFAAVSDAAGLTAMRATPFLPATMIGMTPMTILYVAVGAAVRIDPVVAGIGGVVAAVLLVAPPRLVERFDLFGLRRVMGFATDNQARMPAVATRMRGGHPHSTSKE